MTLRTPDEAAETLCPFSRTFGLPQASKGCHGPSCALWRWEVVTTAHPLWRDAVKAEAAKTGEKVPYPKAAAHVADNKEAYGLIPTKGYCGAGGAP